MSMKNSTDSSWDRTRVLIQGTLYSCQILKGLEFSRQFFEKHSHFMKIRPAGAELFHADRDMTKLFADFEKRASKRSGQSDLHFGETELNKNKAQGGIKLTVVVVTEQRDITH